MLLKRIHWLITSVSVFQVQMGNLNFSLGKVQYDNLSLSTFPLEAQIGVGVGASIVALIVLIIVLIYRSVDVRTEARHLFSPVQ